MKSNRVIFLVGSLESGGTENYLLRFLEYLSENPQINLENFTVVSKSGKGGTLEKHFKETGVSINLLKLGYFNLKANIILFKIFRQKKGVVCDLTGNFAGLPMLIAKLAGVKVRVSFYRASTNHFNPSFIKNAYNRLINAWVYKYSTIILSNSKAAFEYFFAHKFQQDRRFKMLKNGVNINKFGTHYNKNEVRKKFNIPLDVKVVGHVGRLNKAKNFETLIQVASLIIKHHKNIHFVFCGRGTDQTNFKDKLMRLGISENCHTLGQQSNVAEVLNAYDLFYFPSITEGQPNALIEALMSGLPFVASNIDAISECLPPEATSYLVSPTQVKQSANKIMNTLNMHNPLILKDWAIKEYDATKRFDEFKNILLTTT